MRSTDPASRSRTSSSVIIDFDDSSCIGLSSVVPTGFFGTVSDESTRSDSDSARCQASSGRALSSTSRTSALIAIALGVTSIRSWLTGDTFNSLECGSLAPLWPSRAQPFHLIKQRNCGQLGSAPGPAHSKELSTTPAIRAGNPIIGPLPRSLSRRAILCQPGPRKFRSCPLER